METNMLKRTVIRVPLLLVIAWSMGPSPGRAQDVTLTDAIQCKDFKRNSDGSWFAKDVSIVYGPGKKTQLNFFGPTTFRKGVPINGTDLWPILTAKCGS
jgi:hypothetical protein